MYLNTIIKHWPAEQRYHTRWTRAIRAAKKALERDDISAKTEVTEEEMRLIIRAVPDGAEGAEKARVFLGPHEGFPASEWVRFCKREKEKTVHSLRKEYQADMDKLDEILPEFQRWMEDMQKQINDINQRLNQIAP